MVTRKTLLTLEKHTERNTFENEKIRESTKKESQMGEPPLGAEMKVLYQVV